MSTTVREEYEVGDLDPVGVLEAAAEAEQAERRAAFRKLERPENLACLCRRHHRAKTTGRWRYLRTPDGDYQWHGPYGATYLVTDQRTRRLP